MNWNEQALTWLADSDRHLTNSDAMLTELEERLANTPKPSEVWDGKLYQVLSNHS